MNIRCSSEIAKKQKLPLETLSTQGFRLVQAHLWEEEEKQWYTKHYQCVASQVQSRFFLKKGQQSGVGFVDVGRWLLSVVEGARARPCGVLEVRSKEARMKNYEIFYDVTDESALTNRLEPLWFFMSACFLVAEIDLIQVFPGGSINSEIVRTSSNSWTRTVHRILPQEVILQTQRSPLAQQQLIRMSRREWQETTEFDQYRQSLAYLSKRSSRHPLLNKRERTSGIMRILPRLARRQSKKS